MMRTVAILVLAGTLAACSSGKGPTTEPPPPSVQPSSPPRPSPPPVAAREDQCGARDLAYLVGRPKDEIPVPVNPGQRRVVCTTCPVTMDFSPRRLNILFDALTGLIKEVKCG